MTTSSSSFDSTLNSLGINTPAASQAAANATSGSTTLGQADFLKLMTAQLQNQDPFAPVDNTQMVAQMAQFSSVAGITQMNTTLSAIADKLGGTTNWRHKFIAAPWTDAGFPAGKNLVLTHWYADPNDPTNTAKQKGIRQECAAVSGAAIGDFMTTYPAADSPEPNGA